MKNLSPINTDTATKVNADTATKRAQTQNSRPAPIEASWAPQDPRDRLYDDKATRTEKSLAVGRLVGSFHPVLNVGILFIDSFRYLGGKRALLLWLAIAGLIAGLWLSI